MTQTAGCGWHAVRPAKLVNDSTASAGYFQRVVHTSIIISVCQLAALHSLAATPSAQPVPLPPLLWPKARSTGCEYTVCLMQELRKRSSTQRSRT